MYSELYRDLFCFHCVNLTKRTVSKYFFFFPLQKTLNHLYAIISPCTLSMEIKQQLHIQYKLMFKKKVRILNNVVKGVLQSVSQGVVSLSSCLALLKERCRCGKKQESGFLISVHRSATELFSEENCLVIQVHWCLNPLICSTIYILCTKHLERLQLQIRNSFLNWLLDVTAHLDI